MGEPLRAVLALQSSAWQTMAGGGALWTSLSRRLWLWKVSCGLTVLQLHWNAACRPVYLWLPGVALRKEIICPYCLPEQASSLRERDLDRWSCHRRSSAMCRNWQRWASGVGFQITTLASTALLRLQCPAFCTSSAAHMHGGGSPDHYRGVMGFCNTVGLFRVLPTQWVHLIALHNGRT